MFRYIMSYLVAALSITKKKLSCYFNIKPIMRKKGIKKPPPVSQGAVCSINETSVYREKVGRKALPTLPGLSRYQAFGTNVGRLDNSK